MLRRSARGRRLWLTPALRRQAEQLRQEWLEHGMATAPADRPAAEEAVGGLYRMIGLETPRFVWTDSPAGALVAEWLLFGGRHATDDGARPVPYEKVLADPMWDLVGHKWRDSAWAALERGLGDRRDPTALRRGLLTGASRPGGSAYLLNTMMFRPYLAQSASVYHHRRVSLSARKALAELNDRGVFASPPARLSDMAKRRLTGPLSFPGFSWRLLGRALKEALSIPTGAWGSDPPRNGLLLDFSFHLLDSIGVMSEVYSKLADHTQIYADLAYRELGAVPGLRSEHSRRLDLMAAIARAGGIWLPYPEMCIVIERPTGLHLEPDRGLLRPHLLDGPAMTWRDGFGIHAWHGVSVPAEYTTGDVTAADWRAEPNLERRRLLAERIGYARLLDETHAERVATDDYGTLWRIPAEGDEDLLVVDVLNSTPEPDGTRRRYVLRVPPGQSVPRDAIGWTFGLPPGTYHPTEMT